MVESLRLKLKEQKGFTLIELLAVIVILGIIAAIAIPAIGNVIGKTDNKAKVQDALLIIDAAKLYVADNQVTSSAAPGTETVLTLKGTNSLDSYLDRVKDEGFEVTVTAVLKDDNTVKYSYKIGKHDAVTVLGQDKATKTVSEKDLSAYKK
ncbi:prepilin-type N-terminal cleavage/methylation domain-containing protein [Neobacillus sp.]|uniref:prepilin-type N-terminal cleavage/methylation domain-containing protein n=1 Tax=Neobacillus sp. TaxID=2675273 RepID=UPI0028A0EF71|nr:prepilin-type N-terminal cleavage/methylation domain-containing protein [Neobacillus sp.]